jgi:hypothetical protein
MVLIGSLVNSSVNKGKKKKGRKGKRMRESKRQNFSPNHRKNLFSLVLLLNSSHAPSPSPTTVLRETACSNWLEPSYTAINAKEHGIVIMAWTKGLQAMSHKPNPVNHLFITTQKLRIVFTF